MLKRMSVLVGCEESQVVMKSFRKLGHSAKSCDLQDCSGDMPEHHLKMDIFEALKLKRWDMIILHPPCTKLSVSGNRWYAEGKEKYHERLEAVSWTKKLWSEATRICDRVAMENPVGVLNRYCLLPRPVYIQPWMFGHGETKKTGLWLHGLKPLVPTKIVDGRDQNIWRMPPSPERGKLRSKTYHGVAEAMANQWGKTDPQKAKEVRVVFF